MKRGQKAWLLTWDWCGQHAEVEDKIAAILQPRFSEDAVGKIVELLYALHQYNLGELASYTKQPKTNPYKAEWHNGSCFCGSNPSLHANYVKDLIVEENSETGIETIKWKLPARFKFDIETNQRVQDRGEISESTTRKITGPLSSREIGRHSL